MKNTLFALLLLAGSSHAAISITGAAVLGAHDHTGTNVVAGRLALLIVDTAGDGFVRLGAIGANTTLTSINDPAIYGSALGTTIGSTFGDDLVLNTMTTSASGAVSGLLTNVSIADYLGMNFAVVWLESDAYGYWGIVRGADWTFPLADSGTYSMSNGDASGAASYHQVNSNAPVNGSYNFYTGLPGGNGGAVFAWIPEPSVALLGGLGALGLLRRRRR